MHDEPQTNNEHELGEVSSLSVLAARLTWMMVGPLLLAFMTYSILAQGTGWVTAWDAAFLVIVLLMLGARWVDHRSGSAMTVTGTPATDEHLRRYLRAAPAVAAGVWLVANIIGNHVISN
jgi:hypothetical protein